MIRIPQLRRLPGRVIESEYLVLWLCLIYFLVMTPFTPGLASPGNLANLLYTLLPLFVAAMGQTVVLITAGIDLSMTSIIALTSVTGAAIMTGDGGLLGGHPLAVPAALLAMTATGALVGLLNGLSVSWLRLPPFIATLTAMMFFSGFAIWLTRSDSIFKLPSAFNALGGNWMMALGITAVLAVATHLMLTRTLLGRWLYAVGHNPKAALISGVPVAAITATAYVFSGGLAAWASVLYTGQAETGSPVLGQNILLDIIGATVIGGTSLFGGKGKILWTLFGVLFLKLIDNSLNLLGCSHFTILMAKGGVILLAALMDSIRNRHKFEAK